MTATETATVATPATRGVDFALWSLLFGNFIIGTGVLLPAGMLSQLASDLGVSVPAAAWLMLAGGITIGFGAPLAAAITSGIDRRLLLLGSLALYAAGHLASILAPNFAVLLALRVVTVVAAGVFTPQAAAIVGLLVPPERRAAGVAFIFLGWSISLVSGTSVAGLIATYASWRLAYALMAGASLLALWLVAVAIPKGLRAAPLSLASWGLVFGSPALLLILLVTVANSSGQFTVLTFLQPALKSLFAASPGEIAGVLAVFGVFGIAGNAAASRLVANLGAERLIAAALAAMAAEFLVLFAAPGSLVLAVVAVALWGGGTFSSNSLQQARLIGRAAPLASASVALNTSAIYIGQAVGPAVGGVLISAGHIEWLAIAACGFLLAALGLSLLADRVS